MEPISIGGAWTFTPAVHRDDRGYFLEWFRAGELADSIGYWPQTAQANCSVSRRGVIRGIHFSAVPPGQAKYVTCVSGAVLDVIVDIRVGSPSYATWEAVRLDEESRRAVFLAEGLGHAFTALTDQATVIYLCSTPYAPGREHGVHPLDPDLGIEWPPGTEPVLSPKDAAAPTLEEMIASTDRALLLTCLWYIRDVDPQVLLLTGLTRDGVYLVEHGEVVGAVNNFRFNESPVAMLGRLLEVGGTVPTLPREWGDYFNRAAMPPVRVEGFNMSSVSQAS